MTYKYIKTQALLNKKVLTYKEILNIKKRFTGYTKSKDIKYDEANFKDEYKITKEHTKKGLKYLFKVAFKPSQLEEQKRVYKKQGLLDKAIRSNSPLNYRELNILLQFNHFTFTGFYDNTNIYQADFGYKNLCPIWKCYDKDGYSFEYYLEAGEMHIIG